MKKIVSRKFRHTESNDWVCLDCGRENDLVPQRGATFHNGPCDICHQSNVPITQKRDYIQDKPDA